MNYGNILEVEFLRSFLLVGQVINYEISLFLFRAISNHKTIHCTCQWCIAFPGTKQIIKAIDDEYSTW